MMNGKKRTRIEFYRRESGQSTTGQPTEVWNKYGEAFASIVTLRGSAYYAAQQTANVVQIEAWIHYRSDIRASDEVDISGTRYEIAAPPENVGMMNRETLLRLRHVE